MNISFGKGFVRIPSKNEFFNPDNVQTISTYRDETSILMNDCICIQNINATPEEVAIACVKAQNEGIIVDVKENKTKKIYA